MKKEEQKIFDDLIKSISSVGDWTNTAKYQTRVQESMHAKNMGSLKEGDVKQILLWRPRITIFFFIFLSIQFIAVMTAIFLSDYLDLSDTTISVMITGVLGETFGIVFLIVNFIFSKIDFSPVHKE